MLTGKDTHLNPATQDTRADRTEHMTKNTNTHFFARSLC